MSTLMVRAKVKEESVADVEAAAGKMFEALHEAQPAGVRHYASYRAADGTTFVAVLELEDGMENPLPEIAAWREFQDSLKAWLEGPPTPEQLEVVGAYRSS